MLVIKRDGKEVKFDFKKIEKAVAKAFKEVCCQEIPDGVLDKIKEILPPESSNTSLSVESIQDIVEAALIATNNWTVAKAYTTYRYKRQLVRESKAKLMNAFSSKLMAKAIENQNANVDEASFGGRIGEATRVMTKDWALNHCMSKMARENHLNNEIYIHDLDSYAVGMHNCTVRETKFCTRDQGVQSFENYKDGDKICVLTHLGNYQNATVHSYGKQKVNKITFSFAGQRFVTERFTSNHRWILKDGSITTNLKPGDCLYKAPIQVRSFDWNNASENEKYFWCLGFVLADGTEAYRWSHGVKNENIKFVRLRLCGDKTKYESRFNLIQHSVKTLYNGDLYLTFSSVINFKKELPNLSDLTINQKIALFDGFYSADGQHSGSRKSILTANEQIASFIEDEAPSFGWFISNEKDKSGEVTNYGTRKFTKEYTFIGDKNKYYWRVEKIESDSEEEVWCLDVENDHSFVLPNGIVTGNCLSIPFDDLLAKGFNTRQTDVRPANSINTAFQLVAVIFQLQSLQQFGGVSATHLDWTMVPYVRKSFAKHYAECMNIRQDSKYQEWKPEFYNENGKIPLEEISIDNSDIYSDKTVARWALKLTEKELKQAAEGLFHNLNTLQSRSGNQLPFTSINFGTCTLPEGRMVIKALLEGSINGVGKFHKTPIFPCSIFQYMKGVNDKEGTPNYDLYQLALKSTSLRLYPNYANVDWSGNAGYDRNDPRTYFSTMGCRTANGWDINGFGQLKDGRGNICPVTIILPTLAMEADRKVDAFMALLDQKINEAKDMLIERFNWICSQNPNSAKFMYENGTMTGYVPEEGIISALKHGTLAIGQIALAETLQLLIGEDQTTERGMALAKRIEKLFKDRCAEFKEKYKLNFGVYYTPAENLCYTSMKKFKEKYGVIPQVSDKEFFTNSIHVPVWHKCNPFEKIDIESQLTGFSSAGCITYVELPSTTKNNIEGLQTIVDYAMSKDIPYFAVNVPNDTCNNCGYQDEIGNNCPQCGSGDIARLRRVTGYLTGDYKTAFNLGKQDEVEHRVKHIK